MSCSINRKTIVLGLAATLAFGAAAEDGHGRRSQDGESVRESPTSPKSPIHSFSTFHFQLSINRNPFCYSGCYNDFESSFYYLKARYYSAGYGVFSSRDTYDLSNRYEYCRANPVNNTDPEGHAPGRWSKFFRWLREHLRCCCKSDRVVREFRYKPEKITQRERSISAPAGSSSTVHYTMYADSAYEHWFLEQMAMRHIRAGDEGMSRMLTDEDRRVYSREGADPGVEPTVPYLLPGAVPYTPPTQGFLLPRGGAAETLPPVTPQRAAPRPSSPQSPQGGAEAALQNEAVSDNVGSRAEAIMDEEGQTPHLPSEAVSMIGGGQVLSTSPGSPADVQPGIQAFIRGL